MKGSNPLRDLMRGAIASALLVCAAGIPAAEEHLVRSNEAASQSIPLLLADKAPDGRVAGIILQWMAVPEEGSTATNSLNFQFLDAATPEAASTMRSYVWVPSLASAIAWQQPWRNAYWAIREPPVLDGPDNNLALGVGLIAAASHTLFPQDTAAIGTINPDNSIGAVTGLDQRLRAAAKGGIKHVVVPSVQRIYLSSANKWTSVESEAAKLGLKCSPVDSFEEAVVLILGKTLPPMPGPSGPIRHDPALFSFLNQRCERVQATLDSELNMWRRRVQLSKLDSVEARLLEQAVQLHEAGISAYRAGQPYYSREVLLEARAKLAAIAGWQAAGQNFDLPSLNEQAQLLRKAIADRMGMRPAFDREELVPAIIAAEQFDWLGRLQARIEGAQILARQALAPNSDATEGDRTVARVRLVTAIHQTRLLLQDQEADFYQALAGNITQKTGRPADGQAQFWTSAMVPTCLSAGEVLFRGLKDNADRFKETFVFDGRLASCARLLRDAKLWWEAQREWNQRQVLNRESASGRLGFTPGFGYQEDMAKSTNPPPERNISATADCLSWINTLTEVDALRAKYLVMDGAFDSGSAQWLLRSDALLERMIQASEAGARRGIAFLNKLGVDPAPLRLIHERADGLRHSLDAVNRVEALRQYWRCSLLGSLCWQLALPAPEPTAPAPVVAADDAAARRALPAGESQAAAAPPQATAPDAPPEEPPKAPPPRPVRRSIFGRRMGPAQTPKTSTATQNGQPWTPSTMVLPDGTQVEAPKAVPVAQPGAQATPAPTPMAPGAEQEPQQPPKAIPVAPTEAQPPPPEPANPPRAIPVSPTDEQPAPAPTPAPAPSAMPPQPDAPPQSGVVVPPPSDQIEVRRAEPVAPPPP